MTRNALTSQSILMILPEPRVLEVARRLGLNAQSFGSALALVEKSKVGLQPILELLTQHELHFLCVRKDVVPSPDCPRDALIAFLLGQGDLDCGFFRLSPTEIPRADADPAAIPGPNALPGGFNPD